MRDYPEARFLDETASRPGHNYITPFADLNKGRCSPCNAKVLAEGPDMADRLASLGCPPSRPVIQPIPIEIRLFPFRPPRSPAGRAVLLQACRLVEKKGVDLTIQAFARVAVDDAGIELRLVGDGPERPSLARHPVVGWGLPRRTEELVSCGPSRGKRPWLSPSGRRSLHERAQPTVVVQKGGPVSDRPLVLHYRARFLPASETFTYSVIANHQRYRAAALTHERVSPASRDPAPVHVLPEPTDRLRRTMRRWIWPTRLPQRRAVVRAALDQLRPALIHAHFGEDAVVASAAAAASGPPSVAAFYGYDATVLARSPFWRRRFRRLFRQAAAVLAEGPAMADRLAALGCPSDRLVVQPIPIDLRLFRFRPPLPRPGRTVLLQACRFVEKKGVDLTLRAFARLAAEHEGLELRLIGDGPERARLLRLARESGAADRIIFLGMLSHEDYARELADADIFVQPSRTAGNGDGEGGAPTTLLEAQAVGLPIVASTHADIPWVVDPAAAMLAQEGDLDHVTEQLRYLLTHPGEWVDRAHAGRRHVVSRHAADAVTSSLESLYDRILDGRTAREAIA